MCDHDCYQVSVHDECRDQLEDRCDYGQHRVLIVPPERVVTRQGRTVSSLRRKVISHVAPPPEPSSGDSPSLEAEIGTRPLIVVGNNKSGKNKNMFVDAKEEDSSNVNCGRSEEENNLRAIQWTSKERKDPV